jgi:uncharacterized protein (DUF2147 family)
MWTTMLGAALWASVAASPVGVWKTIDDETGKPRAHVRIQESNGTYSGRIVHLVDPDDPNPKCTQCSGAKKNAPVIGLEILWGLEQSGNVYQGGHILDPENGKTYDCKIWLEDEERLKVRGSWFVFGRNQTWHRIADAKGG